MVTQARLRKSILLHLFVNNHNGVGLLCVFQMSILLHLLVNGHCGVGLLSVSQSSPFCQWSQYCWLTVCQSVLLHLVVNGYSGVGLLYISQSFFTSWSMVIVVLAYCLVSQSSFTSQSIVILRQAICQSILLHLLVNGHSGVSLLSVSQSSFTSESMVIVVLLSVTQFASRPSICRVIHKRLSCMALSLQEEFGRSVNPFISSFHYGVLGSWHHNVRLRML